MFKFKSPLFVKTSRGKQKSNLPAMLRKALQAGVKSNKLEWNDAAGIKKDLDRILRTLDFSYIDPSRIFCFRTLGSKSRSYARIWAMPKIFQRALNIKPAYIIEVLSRYYDKLDDDSKKKVLIHELLHIPKNFSGALVPHRTRHRYLRSQVNQLFKEYKKISNS